jgi:hypothetical protein
VPRVRTRGGKRPPEVCREQIINLAVVLQKKELRDKNIEAIQKKLKRKIKKFLKKRKRKEKIEREKKRLVK